MPKQSFKRKPVNFGKRRDRRYLVGQTGIRILKIAQSHNIENRYLDPGPFNSKFDENAENAWIETSERIRAELDCLGWLHENPQSFLHRCFSWKILNLHPSLLPSFTGLHAVNQAFDHGVKISGCTVHWVNEDLDGGRIIPFPET